MTCRRLCVRYYRPLNTQGIYAYDSEICIMIRVDSFSGTAALTVVQQAFINMLLSMLEVLICTLI